MLDICPTQAVPCSPPTNHTFSYLDDIADLAVIRGRAPSTSAYRDGLLRRDEETSASEVSDTVTPSSVVSSCSAAVLQVLTRVLQLGFMKQYGYLAAGTDNSEALHTEAAITEAVKQMQRWGGLAPTGRLDEATLEVRLGEAGVM